MQCDWTSSTRENKLLRKHLGWTLNPGARRRKVGEMKEGGAVYTGPDCTSGAHRELKALRVIQDQHQGLPWQSSG